MMLNVLMIFQIILYNILQRCNKDTGRVNKYGTKLVDFCKRCNLFIANGRMFSDKGVGRTTCKDASMVDYQLLSPNIINIITDFEIIDFNPMFSDVHNRVHLTLTVEGENNQHNPIDNPNINPRVRWRSHKVNEFIQVINDDPHNTLNEINNTLNEVGDSTHVTVEQVNSILNDLGTLLVNSATTVFGVNKQERPSRSTGKP